MKINQLLKFALVLIALSLLPYHKLSIACSLIGKISVAHTCMDADLIVRAQAVKYDEEPGNLRTTGVPDSKVEFEIKEVLKGDSISGVITLNGYLNDKDDFNDSPVPYSFVRPNGRHGSCFANTYKQGAEFLLFLKKSSEVKWPKVTTDYTVDIAALAPVNEQLHSENDPWIFYVKGLIKGLEQNSKSSK